MRNAILVGNYGVGNLGDEALRLFFIQELPDVRWTVLSARPSGPNELPRLPAGPRSLLFTPWWKTLQAIKRTDAVVFGGGSLFTDVESSFACFLWWLHAAVARRYGKPVLLAAQGIGPFRTRLGGWFARRAVAGASYISVRDRQSFQRIDAWPKNIKVIQTFDPVFSLFQKQKFNVVHKNCITIIPRHNSGKTLTETVVNHLRDHSYDDMTILLLHADHPKEQSYAASLLRTVGKGAVVRVDTLEDLCRQVSLSALVISHRYHGALAAMARGVPVEVISQGEDDKLASLRPGSGLPVGDVGALAALARHGLVTLRQALA